MSKCYRKGIGTAWHLAGSVHPMPFAQDFTSKQRREMKRILRWACSLGSIALGLGVLAVSLFVPPSEMDVFARLAVAIACGAIIGFPLLEIRDLLREGDNSH